MEPGLDSVILSIEGISGYQMEMLVDMDCLKGWFREGWRRLAAFPQGFTSLGFRQIGLVKEYFMNPISGVITSSLKVYWDPWLRRLLFLPDAWSHL